MRLFVCETATQLINIINIQLSLFLDEEADLCVCCTNEMIKKIVGNIVDTHIFKNVYTFEIANYADQSFASMLKKAVRGIKYVEYVGDRLPNKDKDYSDIFISGPGLKCICVYYYFKHKQKSTRLNLYEEGVYEYYIFQSKKHRYRRPYSKLFFGRYYIDDCKAIYVYEPDLLKCVPDSVSIEKIPLLRFENEKLRCVLNAIFNFSSAEMQKLTTCKCLYLEQQFPTCEENEKQLQLIKILSSLFLPNEFIIKLHPASCNDKYRMLNVTCLKTSQSMEMFFLNGFNKNIRLFTICSTAAFSPYLMFKYTPEINLLYPLFQSITVDPGLVEFIERFMKEYPSNKYHLIKDLGK